MKETAGLVSCVQVDVCAFWTLKLQILNASVSFIFSVVNRPSEGLIFIGGRFLKIDAFEAVM